MHPWNYILCIIHYEKYPFTQNAPTALTESPRKGGWCHFSSLSVVLMTSYIYAH